MTWRETEAVLRAERETFAMQTTEQIMTDFADLAEAGRVSPRDAVTLTYMLGTDNERQLLAGWLLMCKPWPQLVQAHNFYVASQREPSFIQIYGDVLMTLVWPLFPASREFSVVNTRILCECRNFRGRQGDFVPSVYRESAWRE